MCASRSLATSRRDDVIETSLYAVCASGFGLGLVTAVSPCPLATNVAAVVWLARHAARRRRAVVGAVAYTLGRILAYGAIALLLTLGALSAPSLSAALQQWLPPLVGPLLVLTAMVLLDLLPLPWVGGGHSQATAERLVRLGVFGELLLGFLSALTFCPVSAALFFGSLLPQALAGPATAPPVIAFGIGTAIPVAVFALGAAFSAGFVARCGAGITRWQPRIRRGTGVVLLLLGLYLVLRDTLGWPGN
jgi:cytochrome c-type biogenesis protein